MDERSLICLSWFSFQPTRGLWLSLCFRSSTCALLMLALATYQHVSFSYLMDLWLYPFSFFLSLLLLGWRSLLRLQEFLINIRERCGSSRSLAMWFHFELSFSLFQCCCLIGLLHIYPLCERTFCMHFFFTFIFGSTNNKVKGVFGIHVYIYIYSSGRLTSPIPMLLTFSIQNCLKFLNKVSHWD